jgi:hypothetical protein
MTWSPRSPIWTRWWGLVVASFVLWRTDAKGIQFSFTGSTG